MQKAVQSFARGKNYKPLEIKKSEHRKFGEKDKIHILQDVLENSLLKKDSSIFKDKKNIILVSDNIPQNFTPKISGIKFILIPSNKIQETLQKEKDLTFLWIDEIKANGDNIVFSVAYGPIGNRGFNGNIYEYQKRNNKWFGKICGGWIV